VRDDGIVDAARIKEIARDCGFELAGIAPAGPVPGADTFLDWVRRGMAAGMTYLTDHRAQRRIDARTLLPSARSVLCVAKLYNTAGPQRTRLQPGHGWISRYAWGLDYHDVLHAGLELVVARLREVATDAFDYKICVDTAPLIERSLAAQAGLGWIGKNTCLINQGGGSWFFLGELLLSIDVEANGPVAGRCGTCTRCIEACPTQAIVQHQGRWEVDSRLCISYHTIESREPIPENLRAAFGEHIFGCDICQDVCPWNKRAASTLEAAFAPAHAAPLLQDIASLSPEEFAQRFLVSPVKRARHAGMMRNVAVAVENGQGRASD
jgi:epoxyqueuosine reductase